MKRNIKCTEDHKIEKLPIINHLNNLMQGADLYTQFSFKNIEIANGVHIGLQGKALKRD